MSRTKQEIPEDESPEAKFRRVAEPRLKKAIRFLNSVTKMANGSNYTVTEEDAEKIETTLQETIDNLGIALSGAKQSKEVKDIF